jgi:hypothetical protein
VEGELEALLVTVSEPVTLPDVVGAKMALQLADCPAASVSGRVRPLILKPVPLAVAAESVTLAVPVLVIVTFCVALVPRLTLPKLMLAGEAETCSVTPAPLRATVAGELLALLATLMAPVEAPVAAGAKVAEKALDWPAARVRGNARPLRLKPVPLAVAAVTVTAAEPVLVSVTLCVELPPTITFPKLMLAGEALSCRLEPDPLKAMVVGESVAVLVTATLPLALPALVGANVAFSATLFPGKTVTGKLRPLALKPVPDAVTALMVTLAEPVFVSVTLWVLALPTFTGPKLTLVGDAPSK